MPVWIFEINIKELLKTLAITFSVTIIGFLVFYFLWVKNEDF